MSLLLGQQQLNIFICKAEIIFLIKRAREELVGQGVVAIGRMLRL